MNTYAGIGSRKITPLEEETIKTIAKKLAELGYVCLSGNADGADHAFQVGSDNNCVVMLPWQGFNEKLYDVDEALDHYDLGESQTGIEAAEKYHPHFKTLNKSALKLHARNYHQIAGYDKYPKVDFVICCSDPDPTGGVKGGTGQAVRIAKKLNVPVINIREDGWQEQYEQWIFDIETFGGI